jgi:hypothetical protein
LKLKTLLRVKVVLPLPDRGEGSDRVHRAAALHERRICWVWEVLLTGAAGWWEGALDQPAGGCSPPVPASAYWMANASKAAAELSRTRNLTRQLPVSTLNRSRAATAIGWL